MRIGSLATLTILVGLASACAGSSGSSSTGASGGHDAGTSSTSSTSTGSSDCNGVCVAGPPNGWDYPGLLWIGTNEANAPDCPAMTKLSYDGRADISAPVSCETCTCSAASGTNCTPSPATQPPQPAPTWATVSRGCQRFPYMGCDSGKGLCVPSPPQGFRVCIFHDGVKDCSAPELAPYTEVHVLYETADDTRSCAACTCGPPSGGMCAPSGGEPMGAATPTNPSTFCCMPLP